MLSQVTLLRADGNPSSPSASRERPGHRYSHPWVETGRRSPGRLTRVICLQFNIKKSTEPVQPRALLKFPDIYGPRPAVTAPEVINYADYTLRTTEEPAASASPQPPSDSRLKRQVTEELFILPQNGRASCPSPLHEPHSGVCRCPCRCWAWPAPVS